MHRPSVNARRWALTSRATASLGLALVLLVVAGLGGVREHVQAITSGNWTFRALEVIAQANLVLVGLIDAETGQRGYLLTADMRYLEPYHAAVRALPARVARLRELTADNPAQTDRVTSLDPLVTAKLDEFHSTIALRRRNGTEAALRVIGTGQGKATMDRIRGVIGEITERERALFEERLSARSAHVSRARELIALATLLGAALVGASMLGLNRHARRRLAAERAVYEERQRLDITLRSIGDAVISADLGGHVVFMNAVAERLTGWRLFDARGKPVEQVFHIVNEETRATAESPVARALREGTVVGLANHTALVAKDGREMPLDDSAAPIVDVDGACVGAVLVFRDVADRRRAEQERERLAQVEAAQAESRRGEAAREELLRASDAANRAKDEFLGVLSHELRSPLNAMFGWVSLLRKGALTSAKRERALEIIERNVHLQARLVDDLLDVSRIVSGKLAIEQRPIDLEGLVGAAVEDVRPAAAVKGVQLVFSLGRLPGPVDGDEKRLRQVLTNLLTNAVKFTPRGGQVSVTLASHEGEASVEIADTGAGIAPDFLPHIFDRFQQADASNTRSQGGLGMGLPIARTLAELHGGRIEVRSNGLGKGATFTLHLPLQAAPLGGSAGRGEPESTERARAELAGVAVMLVEDNADAREAMALAFEQSGARVHACGSVAEALRVMDRETLDVIVSDIGMPGENGYELIEKVRAHGSHIPAVAMTGFASAQDREAARRSGFDEHLAKPVTPEALVAKVRQMVQPGEDRAPDAASR